MEDAPATVNPLRPISRRFLGALLASLGLCAFAAPAVAAPGKETSRTGSLGNLNPFSGKHPAAPGWDPIRRTSQNTPATPAAGKPAQPAEQTQSGDRCDNDAQCPAGTICENNVCVAVEPPIRALLFRKEGGSTWFIPFYFSHPGNPGYRLVPPFYWHFWSPETHARIIAPFYWRFEDHIQNRVVTVIPPYSHTKQPDAESWAIWPLFYRSTKFGWAAPPLLSFKVSDPDQGRSFGLYGLLYFWKRDVVENSAFDLFFPFFVSSRSADRAFTYALPLNFYWRRGERSNLLILPLLYRQGRKDGQTTVSLLGYGHRTPERSAGSVAWLYWYGRSRAHSYDLAIPLFYWSRHQTGGTLGSPLGYFSREGRNRRGSVAWLYWFGRKTDGSKYDVLFPVLWSFRSPRSGVTALPPYLHIKRPTWTLSTVFPLYWSGSDRELESNWRLLFPLFFSRKGEHDRSFTWITPLGGYRRNDVNGSRTLAFILPPMVIRRDPRRELDMALGLYWRYRNLTTAATTTLVGPYYRRSDPRGSSTTFFPLFWHFRDAATNSTAHALLPLYFRRSGGQGTLTAAGLLPLLWGYYGNHPEQGWRAGLFPLAFFASRADRGHGVVFPLFWRFWDRHGSATVAAPFFYRFTNRSGTTAAIPPLLYFYGRDERDTYHVQFPLFWRFYNHQKGQTTTVVPPLYYRSGRGGWSGGLFPFLFAGRWPQKRHLVLFPLFWRFSDDVSDRHTTVLANYMHRRHGNETTDALFPLLHYRRGAKPGGKPETSFTLFPLLHYRRSADAKLFLSPLAMSSRTPERKLGFVLPYFWFADKNVAASGVPPLYFDVTNKTRGERTRVFGPFVALDGPQTRARVLFPLFGRFHSKDDRGTWVFPTFFHRRTRDGYALDTVFPLFWYSRWPGHTTTVVGPWYRRSGPKSLATGLAPLFFYAKNEKRRYFLTPLFYSGRSYEKGTSRTLAAFLFYRSTRPDGHRTVLFPLYWGNRNGPRSSAVLFPVFWRFADAKEDSAKTLAGPFYWSHHGKTQRTRGLLPLMWYSRDDEARTASHAILPLFYEKHGPSQLTVFTAAFGFKREPDQSWWYALNVFRKNSVSSTFTMVFPLWFSHHNKLTNTTTRVVPPLLHFSRSRPDRSLSGWLLLFWRQRGITSSTTLVLPLFYDIHRFHQSRFTLLAPLFFRYWGAQEQTSYTLAPLLLFYRRSAPTSSSTVAFPLFWDFRNQDRRTTVLFPLFVGVRRPNYIARYVFPNIYYRSGRGPEAGTSRLFIFPFWESAVKRPGDYMWEVLLGLVGAERIGRNRYLKLLFIPFELDPAPAAQTAWYGKAPPRKRPLGRRSYGLNTRAW